MPVALHPGVLKTAGRYVDLRRLPPQTGLLARVDIIGLYARDVPLNWSEDIATTA